MVIISAAEEFRKRGPNAEFHFNLGTTCYGLDLEDSIHLSKWVTGQQPIETSTQWSLSGQGEKVQGEKVQGEKIQGEKVQGEKVQGEKIQGEKIQGEKIQGEKIQGQKVQGQKVQGEKIQGEKIQGEKVQGEKVLGCLWKVVKRESFHSKRIPYGSFDESTLQQIDKGRLSFSQKLTIQ